MDEIVGLVTISLGKCDISIDFMAAVVWASTISWASQRLSKTIKAHYEDKVKKRLLIISQYRRIHSCQWLDASIKR